MPTLDALYSVGHSRRRDAAVGDFGFPVVFVSIVLEMAFILKAPAEIQS